jgi:hypothetical protein
MWEIDPTSGQLVFVSSPGGGSGGGGSTFNDPYGIGGDPHVGGGGMSGSGYYWDPAQNKYVSLPSPYPSNAPPGYMIWNGSQWVQNPNFASSGAGGTLGGQGDTGHQGQPGQGGGAGGLVPLPSHPGFMMNPSTGQVFFSNGQPFVNQGQQVYYNSGMNQFSTTPPGPMTQQPQTNNPADPTVPGGTGPTAGGGTGSWAKYAPFVYGGLNAIQGFLGSRNAAAAYKAAANAQNATRAQSMALASPGNLQADITGQIPFYQQLYKPGVLNQGQAISLAREGNLQSFDADVARRGLGGSGIQASGENAIRGGATAAYSDALRKYNEDVYTGAVNTGSDIYHTQVGASQGTPIASTFTPSAGSDALNALISGGGAYALAKTLKNYPYLYPGQ